MKFAMFFVAEYTNLFIVSAVASTLFLGGWQGPFLPSVFWFLIKAYGIIFLLMWVRWTLPRVRMDQMMGFAWKVLTPLALLNLLISGWLMVR
jgi:NADH-quinone oxidoreductase subunit H